MTSVPTQQQHGQGSVRTPAWAQPTPAAAPSGADVQDRLLRAELLAVRHRRSRQRLALMHRLRLRVCDEPGAGSAAGRR